MFGTPKAPLGVMRVDKLSTHVILLCSCVMKFSMALGSLSSIFLGLNMVSCLLIFVLIFVFSFLVDFSHFLMFLFLTPCVLSVSESVWNFLDIV